MILAEIHIGGNPTIGLFAPINPDLRKIIDNDAAFNSSRIECLRNGSSYSKSFGLLNSRTSPDGYPIGEQLDAYDWMSEDEPKDLPAFYAGFSSIAEADEVLFGRSRND